MEVKFIIRTFDNKKSIVKFIFKSLEPALNFVKAGNSKFKTTFALLSGGKNEN